MLAKTFPKAKSYPDEKVSMTKSKYDDFVKLVAGVQNVVITTHLHPDADGIGSQVALGIALCSMGKNAICVNERPLMERYKYLDPHNILMSSEQFKQKYKAQNVDLFVVVDTCSASRIGTEMEIISNDAKNFLYVDHHPAPKEIAAIHCIDTSMSATGELVANLIKALGIEYTKDIALPLYTAILIDTSSFRYPTVTGDTHRALGSFLDVGVEPPKAYNLIYGAKKLPYMQLLGILLSSARNTEDGRVAWVTVKEHDMNRFSVDSEDTHGFVNYLLVLEGIKVACMFRENGKHIKISFRSAGDIDVGIMAQALGGGGHDHSAATVVEGNLKDVVKDTIRKIQKMLG